MGSTKISRQHFRRLPQAQLAIFTENVVTRLKNNPVYSALQTQVAALETTDQQFSAALAAARSGGRAAIVAKDQLREQIFAQLNTLADALDVLAQGNELMLVNAGFEVKNNMTRSPKVLNAPQVIRANSTGRIGEVQVYLSDESPNWVRQHGIEISSDGGATYQNGHYDSRTRFVLTNLPREKNVMLRFRALGRGDLKSPWSEPVFVAVL
jgi:hypothetical protein